MLQKQSFVVPEDWIGPNFVTATNLELNTSLLQGRKTQFNNNFAAIDTSQSGRRSFVFLERDVRRTVEAIASGR